VLSLSLEIFSDDDVAISGDDVLLSFEVVLQVASLSRVVALV